MRCRSNVKIKMGKKAYELLEKRCLESNKEYIKEMVTEPSIMERNGDSILIGWICVNWCPDYGDVEAIMRALKELDSIVENNEESLKDFYYKFIAIDDEDNTIETKTNDNNEEYTGDFYIKCNFSL